MGQRDRSKRQRAWVRAPMDAGGQTNVTSQMILNFSLDWD